MKTKEEILAKIESLLQEVQLLKEAVASLEVNENPTEESPVITIEEAEELPAPPAEVHVDIPERRKETSEDVVLGCSIIASLPDFYNGKCSVLKVHKRYFDNGQPKLFIDKYHVVVEAYNYDMEIIGSVVTHWNNLAKFHAELLKRGINTHSKDNWMPKVLVFDLD